MNTASSMKLSTTDVSKGKTQQKRKISQDKSLNEVGNKKSKIEGPLLNPMVFYSGFQHITEKIFQTFDKESLKSCRLL